MAITEDGSQPAAVTWTGTWDVNKTTASFSPPANSLLVALIAGDGPATSAITAVMSDSGGGTWTLLKRQNTTNNPALGGTSEVWCRYLTSAPGSMTVSVHSSGTTGGGQLVVRVLLGASSVQTGATGGTGSTSSTMTASVTPQQSGGRVYGAALDFTAADSVTANGNSTNIAAFVDTSNAGTWAAFKSSGDTVSGSATTYGYSTPASVATDTAAAEILADSGTTAWPFLGPAPGRMAPGSSWVTQPGADIPDAPAPPSSVPSDPNTAGPYLGPAPGRISPSGVWTVQPSADIPDVPAVVPPATDPGSWYAPAPPGRIAPGGMWQPFPFIAERVAAPVEVCTPVDWGDGITLSVEVALSSATGTAGAWDVGLWDSATWGPDVVWTEVACWVRAIDTDRRFNRDVQAWEAGTASIVLDNRDGRFNSDNLSGPYVTGGVSGVRPARPVRIRATLDGTTYDVYRGYVKNWKESWIPAGPGAGDAIVTLQCSDEFSMLARFGGLEQLAVGGGETTGRRMHRLLDAAGHTGDRCIDDGRITCQPTTLASNTVTEADLVTESEGGALWMEADGCVTFANRYALLENTRSNTVQSTWGDGGGSELPYSDAEAADFDDDQLVNYAAFARADGTVQTATDETSRALYTTHLYSRNDLVCETDSQVKSLADFYIVRYAQPERRIVSITVQPRRDPTVLFPEVLGRRVRDLIRVVRRPPGGHVMTRDVFVSGIHHQIRPRQWTTRFDLWSATAYTSSASARWDEGTWDNAVWFY